MKLTKDYKSNKFNVLKKSPREAVKKASPPPSGGACGSPEGRLQGRLLLQGRGLQAASAPKPQCEENSSVISTIKDLNNIILSLHRKLGMFILVS